MTENELRELDAEIFQKVFGQKPHYVRQGFRPDSRVELCDADGLPVPHYSTDIAAAWKVFERVAAFTHREPWFSENTYIDNGQKEYHVVFGGRFEAAEATAPLAICKAALAVVAEQSEVASV